LLGNDPDKRPERNNYTSNIALLERSGPSRGKLMNPTLRRMEDGPCTSFIVLRVIRGYEKGTQGLGYNWATLILRDINTGTCTSRLEETNSK
jgi:hypothetical protein